VEICRFLVHLVDLYRVGVDCLEVICELRLVCLCSHSTVVPSTFDSRSCFLDSDGRSLLIQKLVSSGVFMGRVDVFSSDMEAKECLSKNEIRSGPLL
ncbi:hypothetical protein A2U01_0070486, partial [Trifolium medium]|nr:hypothetical protein [Trifolium medium]